MPCPATAAPGRALGQWHAPRRGCAPSTLRFAGSVVGLVKSITVNGASTPHAAAGDNVDVVIGGVDEGTLRPGHVLCWPTHPIRYVSKMKAQIAVLPTCDMPLVPGQQFMLHSHTLEEPCNVTRLLRTLDREGHTKDIKPRCLTPGAIAVVRIRTARPVCIDTFADHRRLGRFMLRYSGATVAAGMVLKLTLPDGTTVGSGVAGSGAGAGAGAGAAR